MLKSAISVQVGRWAGRTLKLPRLFSSVGVKVNEETNSSTTTSYTDFIQRRMQEAANTILVQVESDQCYNAAYNHCKQFGSISTAIAYKSDDNRQFLLMEYSNKDCVNEIFASAGFQVNLIPWKNRYLTYRKTQETPIIHHSVDTPIQYGHLKVPLNTSTLQTYAGSFDDQVKHLYDHLRPNDLQQRLRCLAALQVESVLSHYAHEIFPNGKIVPFGSSFHGFGTFDANLDMTLQLTDSLVPIDAERPLEYWAKDFDVDDEQVEHGGRQIKCIAWLLEYFIPDSSLIAPMTRSRPPLARYFDAYVQCRLDVSVNNVYGLRETELLYALGESDARVKPFVLLIHKWAAASGLAKVSKGKFHSIQLTYLAMSFLQQLSQPILPPLEKFYTIHNAGESNVSIDMHPIEFQTNNTNTIGELFREFLEYYVAFDVNANVVTMRTVEKLSKPPVKSAPVVVGKGAKKKQHVIPMYLEKIFFPDENFAENITDIDYEIFLMAIKKTLSALDDHSKSDKKGIMEFLL